MDTTCRSKCRGYSNGPTDPIWRPTRRARVLETPTGGPLLLPRTHTHTNGHRDYHQGLTVSDFWRLICDHGQRDQTRPETEAHDCTRPVIGSPCSCIVQLKCLMWKHPCIPDYATAGVGSIEDYAIHRTSCSSNVSCGSTLVHMILA